jgi:hypothetical protein
MGVVCPSLSFNFRKRFKTFLDNERRDAYLLIQETPEDTISGVISILYLM